MWLNEMCQGAKIKPKPCSYMFLDIGIKQLVSINVTCQWLSKIIRSPFLYIIWVPLRQKSGNSNLDFSFLSWSNEQRECIFSMSVLSKLHPRNWFSFRSSFSPFLKKRDIVNNTSLYNQLIVWNNIKTIFQ